MIFMVASGQPPSTRVIDVDKGEESVRIMGIYGGSGSSVAGKDINGDGFDDIIIGAPWAPAPNGRLKGAAYIIFGNSFPKIIKDLSIQSPNMTIYGEHGFDAFGWAVSSGDINGDGYYDVIIGARDDDPALGRADAGSTYVIFGSAYPRRKIDLQFKSADMTIYGESYKDMSGQANSTGDINGDGYDDIIIGAYLASPGGRINAGKSHIIFGGPAPSEVIDLNSQPADMSIYGDDDYDQSGYSVSSGDINADGYDDVIIGARGASPDLRIHAGETYVIFGSTTPPTSIDLDSQSADMTIYGDDDDDQSGFSVSSGDINGDGYDDIIIGAHLADPAGGDKAGATYVIFGSDSLPTSIDLNTESADMVIYGDDEGDHNGHAVSSGDINTDGYDDIVIGAWGADTPGGTDAGKTYIIFGSASPPTTIDLNSESADITVHGDNAEDLSGTSVASGDIDNDGFADVIIGASYAKPGGRTYAGETYVILGSGLPINCDFSDVKVKDWQQIGTGRALLRNEQLILRDASLFYRIFPPGAVSNECDIEVKMQRNGGIDYRVSSSILFSHKNKKNCWELRMLLLPVGSRVAGKWILLHKKDGVIVQREVVNDDISRRQQYLIQIEVRESQIRVVVDGVEKINITPDEKPIWGKIGLGIRGEGACFFDDLIIN